MYDSHFVCSPKEAFNSSEDTKILNLYSICVTCFMVGPDLVNMPKEKNDGNFGKHTKKHINHLYIHVIVSKLCLQLNYIICLEGTVTLYITFNILTSFALQNSFAFS